MRSTSRIPLAGKNNRDSDEELIAKFREYRDTRDPALRDVLFCAHMPLVYSLAQKYANHGEPLEDLVQEGSIGLLKAIDYFDVERGVRFSTYACHLIISSILHYLRDCGHLIRQPAWVQELNAKITRTAQELQQELNREPLPQEIAVRLNLTEEAVNEVLAARELNRIVSLTAPVDESDEDSLLLIDREKIHQDKYHTLQLPIEDRIVLEEAINSLKELEQKVLRLFFFGNLTLAEIAHKLSISTPRSAYLLRCSLKKIKTGLETQDREMAAPDLGPPSTIPIIAPTFDKETGVYSETYLRLRVAEEIRRRRYSSASFALLHLHVHGLDGREDRAALLAAVGQLLFRSIHATDVTAYLGNGRFVILLLQVNGEEHLVARRLCALITHQIASEELDGSLFHFTTGIAAYPQDGRTVDQLLKNGARAARPTARVR